MLEKMQKLTKKQLEHKLAFNERTKALHEVDFDHYENPRKYGPWNPYWHVYNYVSGFERNGSTKVLVAGCGNGRDSLIYAKLGFAVHAFDISDRAIKYAQALADRYGFGTENVTFSLQAAEELIFPSDFFDLVVGVNVLHHIDIDKSMNQFCRVLKKGGHAVFKEPLLTPLKTRFRNSVLVTPFIPNATKNVFQKTKYQIIEGEKNLDEHDFETIRKYFPSFEILRWRVVASLDFFFPRIYLEKIDWALFMFFPFLRKFGDQAVLVMSKE